MHTASDFLLVGFPGPKTLTLRSTPHHPVILRGAEGEVAESIIQKITLALRGRGGPSQTVGEGRGRTLTTNPHPPTGTFSLGKR